MSFRAFEKELPDVYILAIHADRVMHFDHVIALGHLQEMGRLLVNKILMNEQSNVKRTEPLSLLEELMNIEILPDPFLAALKKLEYLDKRESDMLIKPDEIKKLFYNMFDLTSWYFKTYIDDQFTPPPMLLKPQDTALNIILNDEHQASERKSNIHIDNKIVKGIWEDGIEGEQYMELEGSESFQGQVCNGVKSGKGVYRWSDGTKYTGQWHLDTEYGFGIKEYANGDRYQGEWKEGLFHGNGVYEWHDGTRFEGKWEDNMEHGFGIRTYTDGTVQRGFWTYGELIFTEDQLGEGKETITGGNDD
ncbi:MORN repeat-containing protein [Bacillus sp. FJAT-28004]|uniref:MORN repeat-containing protein n=1 Tax=Bacillus sp. FJAT-28004 TaxID=1679165 RepID=UPI0006B58266|nr:hypothetical protein [Bacillus sp. FJAT-28004]